MDRRRATAMLAGLALATMELVAPPPPVAAAPADSDTLVFAGYNADTWVVVRNGERSTIAVPRIGPEPLAGDFSAAPGTDLFVYGYGDEPDGVLHVAPTGDGATTSFTPKTVRGSYSPFVGDFDGNGIDDILWYGWEDGADSIWLFRPDGSHRSMPIEVDGRYRPFVIEATGDGRDDVFWYGVGPEPDHLWIFGEGASHTSRPMRVTGDYQPVVGHFQDTPGGTSQEQVVWYSWDGPSNMWTFTTGGGYTWRALPAVRYTSPVVGDLLGTGRDVIFWYGIGGYRGEGLTTVAADGTPRLGTAAPVNGIYSPLVGDLDGDGRQDIAWTARGVATVWTLEGSGTTYTQTRVETGQPQTVGAVVRTDPADL